MEEAQLYKLPRGKAVLENLKKESCYVIELLKFRVLTATTSVTVCITVATRYKNLNTLHYLSAQTISKK